MSRPTRIEPVQPITPGSANLPATRLPPTVPSALAIALATVRQWYLLALFGMVAAATAVVYALLKPREFTSSSAFMAQAQSPMAALGGLAAQLGVSAPGADQSQSPAFYADLVNTREILDAVVDSTYRFGSDSAARSHDLVEYFAPRARSSYARRRAAAAELARLVDANVSQRTGVVRLSVTLHDPALAQQVNERFLALLNEFNLLRRQSQATAERALTERRIEEVRADLHAAEGRVRDFLQANHGDFRSSPQLSVEYDRLSRDVALQQGVYTTLMESYEQMRIETMRDTPVITTIDPPDRPVEPDSRHIASRAMLAFVVGVLFAVVLIGVRMTWPALRTTLRAA